MNYASYGLGFLLLGKWIIRLAAGYKPPRWGDESSGGKWVTVSVAVLTVVLLAYCLTATLNARATFVMDEQRFEYHEYKPNLPLTYDSASSWQAFWRYLALACFFWSLRDWLLTKSKRERRRGRRDGRETEPSREESPAEIPGSVPMLPDRVRLLLWVLCLNGALVAVQGMLQRMSKSAKLLWLVPSWSGKAVACYGPYSYRSNAAQYMNLIWPVCLGFWWTLKEGRRAMAGRAVRVGEGPHLLLIPALIMLLAGPFLSLSRGAALVAGVTLVIATILLFADRRTSRGTRWAMVIVVLIVGVMSYNLGWERLKMRMTALEKDSLADRGEIYENTKQIAADFPLFGTGPGTFASVYHLYRASAGQVWQSHVHDDWLEARVTLGWVGLGLILTMLLLTVSKWFVPGGVSLPFVLVSMIWTALGGCLLHARFDFPFQIYSVLYVFLLLCAVLICSARPRGA